MYPGLGAGAWKASPIALVKLATSIDQSSATGQLLGAGTFGSIFTGSWAVPAAGSPGFEFGLGVEINTGNGDVYKDGKVAGGGGYLVFKNLVGGYTGTSCPSCIVWAALVNTTDPSGNVDTVEGVNQSMIDALNQASVLAAINSATVDMFPAYGLAAGG